MYTIPKAPCDDTDIVPSHDPRRPTILAPIQQFQAKDKLNNRTKVWFQWNSVHITTEWVNKAIYKRVLVSSCLKTIKSVFEQVNKCWPTEYVCMILILSAAIHEIMICAADFSFLKFWMDDEQQKNQV